ncbi:uncharacterized protein K02A2.6-like [Sycon ciliatum]|uniref:uncharacterized protein K02A2.6-like n=1 Tax=Sycon ciliatum TaxID=27933 RepID=UPI0031F6FFD6
MADGAKSQPDINQLVQLIQAQVQASAQRDAQLQTLLQSMSQGSASSTSAPASSAPAPSTKLVAVDRPILLSSANLAEFVSWSEAWEDYSRCQLLSAQPRETRMAAFRQALDEDLRRFVREGVIVVPNTHDVPEAMVELRKFIRRQRNPLLDRIEFYRRAQQPGETFDAWYTSLRELFHACNFAGLDVCSTCSGRMCQTCQQSLQANTDEILRDRIVTGILQDDVRHKLLAMKDLTLATCVDLCRAEEAASQTSSRIPSQATGDASVSAVRSSYKKQKGMASKQARAPAAKDSKSGSKPSPDKCPNCGRTAHSKRPCPAADRKCNGCQRTGHFLSMCPSASKRTVGQLKLQRAASSREGATIAVNTQLVSADKPTSLRWLPDTGSDINAIGPAHLELLGDFIENLPTDKDVVRTADGAPLTSLGKIQATLTLDSVTHDTTLHVYKGLDEALLSRQSLCALNLLPASWPSVFVRSAHTEPNTAQQLQQQLLEEFADVFDSSQLPPMDGPPMDIQLQPGAEPSCVRTARTIPFAYRDQIKSQLDSMVDDRIIEPVTEPSAWCHPIVLVEKKGTTEMRLTVDLRKLNDQVRRPTHPARTPHDAVAAIGKARYFTKLDARHGYWQVPLSDDAKPLTTFITPWGRYQFLRNPQGLVSAGDVFNSRTDAVFDRLTNFVKVVDDGLVYDTELTTHFTHVRDALLRARQHGITLSAKKFVFGVPEVDYCGYHINTDGYTVDSDKTAAITDFPVPVNRTDVRSFFGLINQCSDFSPRIAQLSDPLRPLLKSTNVFLWESAHTDAFNAVKAALASPPILSFFQPGRPLRLETDASVKNGLGYVLWQQQGDTWCILQCGSRFLSDAETRYAVIELECLAVTWAVRKCSIYLSGARFEVITDHRPLIPILNSYYLDQIENPRLQRLVLKLRPYQLHATWRKGTDHAFPDALSRHPVSDPCPDDELGESTASQGAAIRACMLDTSGGLKYHALRSAAQADADYQCLVQFIVSGFPAKRSLMPESLQPYWNGHEHLSIDSGLVMKGPRLLIPVALRQRVLSDLHASHQGLTRTKSRARQIVFWPRLSADIEHVVRSCDKCRLHSASQPKEPLRVDDRAPDLPFQHSSADLFECEGLQYLVYVDRLTSWPCVAKLGRTASSADVIRSLRRWFPDIGVPEVLTSDGGPQFQSHVFAKFCDTWHIRHAKSSPHYPQSNGLAENAVKAMKSLIHKTTSNGDLDVDSFQRALLEWRNTPNATGQSPAQALYGRPLSSFVFAHHSSFAPAWQTHANEVDQRSSHYLESTQQHYNRSARSLPRLSLGAHVDIQHPRTKLWSAHGSIVAIGQHRDYLVKLPSGRIFWRNRRFLRPRVSPTPPPAAAVPTVYAPDAAQGQTPVASIAPGVHAPAQPAPRRSHRHRQQNVPFNVISTRGQSYD